MGGDEIQRAEMRFNGRTRETHGESSAKDHQQQYLAWTIYHGTCTSWRAKPEAFSVRVVHHSHSVQNAEKSHCMRRLHSSAPSRTRALRALLLPRAVAELAMNIGLAVEGVQSTTALHDDSAGTNLSWPLANFKAPSANAHAEMVDGYGTHRRCPEFKSWLYASSRKRHAKTPRGTTPDESRASFVPALGVRKAFVSRCHSHWHCRGCAP
eukprot:scaffold7066_cov253-Pinguiococcus_pyrenoidosus.AAC.18